MVANVAVTTTLSGLSAITSGFRAISTGLGEIQQRGAKVSEAMQGFGRSLSQVGSALSIGVTAPITLAGGALLKFASDAVESESLFEVSMGKMAKQAREFSEELKKSLGLNAFETRKQVGTFNQMFVSMGLGTDAAYEMSKGMVRLGQDMASFFNMGTEESFMKLQAAISGEIEPMKRLGIVINENIIKQEAMNLGIIKLGEELTESQKVGVRYVALLERTKNAQGDLARTINSPTNQLRLMKTQLIETGIELGTGFLPVITAVGGVMSRIVIPALRDLVSQFNALTPAQKGLTLAVIGFAAALGPTLAILGKLTVVLGVLLKGFLFLVSPIGLATAAIVTGLAAVGTATAAVIRNWENLKRSAEDVWVQIKQTVAENLYAMVDLFDNQFTRSVLRMGDTLDEWRGKLKDAMSVDDFAGEEFGETLKESFSGVVEDMEKKFSDLSEKAKELLAAPFKALGDAANQGGEDAAQAVQKQMNDTIAAVKKELLRLGQEAEETDQKRIAKRKKLAEETLEFEISTGQRQLEEKKAFYQQELLYVEEGTEKHLELRRKVAQTNLEIYQRDAELARKSFNDNEVLMNEWLANQKERYAQLGEAGSLVVKDAGRGMKDLGASSIDTAGVVQRSMQQGFSSVLKGSVSLKDGVLNTFRAIGDGIIDEMARVLANKAVAALFGKALGGGGFLGSLFGGGSSSVPDVTDIFADEFHGGGLVGQTSGRVRVVDRSLFLGAPRHHSGLGSNEYAAVLERGEEVLTAKDSRHSANMGRSGPSVVVNQTLQIQTGVSQTVRAEVLGLMPNIIQATQSAVVDGVRRGGNMRKAFR